MYASQARVHRFPFVFGPLLLAVSGLACHSNTVGNPAGDPDAPGSGTQANPDATPIDHPDASSKAPADALSKGDYPNLCAAPRPANAPYPISPNPPVAGCPTLVPGALNTITSSGKTRQFLFITPTNFDPTEKLPVIFLWFWLGGDEYDFLNRGEVQPAVDEQRFIAVIPASEGAPLLGTSFNLKWPFDISQTQARVDEEFQFFDDMLACVEEQANVNRDCVSTAGVSAGALFTDQLAQGRSTTLSSFLSMSGGVGDLIIRPWVPPAHSLPGIVLWGGDGPPTMDGVKDILGCFGVGMDFSVASHTLESSLAPGTFIVECRHNCGHVEPPLDTPPGLSKFADMWDFSLNHPYWLGVGQSPYLTDGLPVGIPDWCAIGSGNSIGRSGSDCPAPENPCVE